KLTKDEVPLSKAPNPQLLSRRLHILKIHSGLVLLYIVSSFSNRTLVLFKCNCIYNIYYV
uniref:Uncharacterized protein n=1 Tax=Sinocyclocheilus rhinocerous TaxID=307959 RepID=A0A673J7R6_9TELE